MEDQVVDEKKRKLREAQERYRQKNKERIKEGQKQYCLKNKEKINEINKQYRLKSKEKRKQYRLENSEKIKQYRLDNKEKINENDKKYRLENKEKIKQYLLQNNEKIKKNKRETSLKNKYDITLDDYEKMLQEQSGSCAICFVKAENQRNKILVVDHNHLTDEVRGLLCSNCNTAIGLLRESQEIIENALKYLHEKGSCTLSATR
jgi:hypothetical protein